jgi:hypothetical protein
VVVDKFIGLVDANMIEDLISNLTRKKKVEWSWGEDSVRAQGRVEGLLDEFSFIV